MRFNRELPFFVASEIRPGQTVSLSGYDGDAAVVTEVQPSFDGREATITLESGVYQHLAVDCPVVVFGE